MNKQLLRTISRGFLYGFVFVLPWQTLYFLREVIIDGEKWEYGTIAIYVSDLFLVSFLISCFGLFLWNYQRDRLVKGQQFNRVMAPLQRHPQAFVTLVIFVVFLFSTSLWSSDPLLSAYGALKLFLGILLVLALWFGSFDLRKIIFIFLLSMLGHAFLGIFQFLWQGDFASTVLGVSKHIASNGGVSVVESWAGDGQGRFLRAYGGFAHPNIFGVVCALCVILSLGSAFVWRSSRYLRAFFFCASIILFAGLVVSFSRNGLIVFFCGMTFLLCIGFFLLRRGDSTDNVLLQHFWRVLVGSVLSYGLVFLLFFLAYGDLFLTRAQGEARLEQLSLTERTNQFQEAFTIIGESALLGTGLGAYTKELMIADAFVKPVWQYQAVHNSYILALGEVGFVGFALLMFLGVLIVHRLYKHRTQLREDRLTCIFFGVCILFLISGVFDHWQWGSHFGILLGALLLGLTLSQLRKVS